MTRVHFDTHVIDFEIQSMRLRCILEHKTSSSSFKKLNGNKVSSERSKIGFNEMKLSKQSNKSHQNQSHYL